MLIYLNFIHKNLVDAKFQPNVITNLEFNSVTKNVDVIIRTTNNLIYKAVVLRKQNTSVRMSSFW